MLNTFVVSLLFIIVNQAKVPQKLGFTHRSSSADVTCINLSAVPVGCKAPPVTTISVIVTSTQGFGVTIILFIAQSTALACTIVGKSASICAAISDSVFAPDTAYTTGVIATPLTFKLITLEATNQADRVIIDCQLYQNGL